MKIAIGSDHRGYEVKERIVAFLRGLGYEAQDMGTDTAESYVDYPDFAFRVAEAVGKKQVDRGILICSTGIGMCIAANKVTGVRAAPCYDTLTSEVSRRHNDANIMCLSSHLLGEESIERMVQIWLNTDFEGGRHLRRIEKIDQFERSEESPSA